MSANYYAMRGRVALDCWTCDLRRCKCDRITMRCVKRGAKQKWRDEMADAAVDVEMGQ